MKTIGLIGGTTWLSTCEYYKIINEETNKRHGGLEFSKCILHSLNFGDIDRLVKANEYDKIYSMILDSAKKLQTSGADCILLCANTLHMFFNKLSEEIEIPVIHIAEAVADDIKKANIEKVGLLGTKQTMEMDFYKTKLNNAGLDVLIPNENERNYIQEMIFSELAKNIFKEETKNRFLQIFNKLKSQGVKGIILGCTEIPLLINQEDTDIKLFDTLEIHAKKAVDFSVS